MAHHGPEHHKSYRSSAHEHHGEKMHRMGVERAHGGGTKDEKDDERLIRKAFAEHDDQLHGGRKTRLKFKDGGAAEGEMARARRDRPHRRADGGASKKTHEHKPKGGKGAHVNVIVAPQSGGMMPHPMGMPAPAGVTPMPPPRPPIVPGMPGGMPPGGGMPMMPPRPMPAPGGIPPRSRGGALALKKGGRAHHRDTGGGSGEDRDEESNAFGMPDKRFKEKMGPYPTTPAPNPRKPGRAKGGAISPLEDKEPKGEGVGEEGAGSGLGRLDKIRAYGDESDKGEGKLHRGGGRR